MPKFKFADEFSFDKVQTISSDSSNNGMSIIHCYVCFNFNCHTNISVAILMIIMRTISPDFVAIVFLGTDNLLRWPLVERTALITGCVSVLCSMVGWCGYLLTTAPSFVYRKVTEKSRSHTIGAPNWLCVSLFCEMRPFWEWKNLFILSFT